MEETCYERWQTSKIETTGDAVSVASSRRRTIPLSFCSQIVMEQVTAIFLLVNKIKIIAMLLNVVHHHVHKKI